MLLIEDVPGLGRAIADTIARGAGAWLHCNPPQTADLTDLKRH